MALASPFTCPLCSASAKHGRAMTVKQLSSRRVLHIGSTNLWCYDGQSPAHTKTYCFLQCWEVAPGQHFQIGGGGRVPAVPNAGSAQKCACAAMSTLVRERSTWTSCLQCAKALCPMKVAPLGRLTSWTPDEWKHPIGMPAGGSEETPCL